MTTIPPSITATLFSTKPDELDEEGDLQTEEFDLQLPELGAEDPDEEKEESFDEAMRRIQQQHLVKNFASRENKTSSFSQKEFDDDELLDTPISLNEHEVPLEATSETNAEVVEDFLRNFLVSKNMFSTLEAFQNEWYEMQQKNPNPIDHIPVPDVYHQNTNLETQLKQLKIEARAFKQLAESTQAHFNQARKEKDYIKLQYQRLLQEKSKLQSRCQQQKHTMDQLQGAQTELQAKLDHMLKVNTLLKLEKEKGLFKKEGERERGEKVFEKGKEKTVKSEEPEKEKPKANVAPQVKNPINSKSGNVSPISSAEKKKKAAVHNLPSENRINTYLDIAYAPIPISRIINLHEVLSINAHSMSVSNLAFHPRKMILASVSDDKSWKLWNFPSGELLICGQGHKNWISGVDFHPLGTHLATSSGDLTIKLWDFSQPQAVLTMSDHLRPVWCSLFHDTGNFLLSCSLDATAKLWDLVTGRCKQTFRAHTDSVNSTVWQHFSNIFYTCSGDKLILSWDARMNHPAQQFRGHATAVNSVTCSLNNELLLSGDAEGMLKLWDPRTTHELLSVNLGPAPVNKVALDPAHSTIAVASQDGHCKLFSIKEKMKREFKSHQDAVQACLFCPMQSEYLITCSSDHTIKLWN